MKMKKNEERKKALKEARSEDLIEAITEENKHEETLGEVLLESLKEVVEAKEVSPSFTHTALSIVENPKNGWWQVVSFKYDPITKHSIFGDVLYESPLKGEVEMRFRMEAAYALNMGD